MNTLMGAMENVTITKVSKLVLSSSQALWSNLTLF